MFRLTAFFIFVLISTGSCTNKGSLELIDKPDSLNIIAAYYGCDKGGNTSVAFDLDDSYKWSGESPYNHDDYGYYTPDGKEVPYIKRDRDLGQTFRITGNKPVKLKALTVRLGFGTNVVRPGIYGEKISLQFYEVSGQTILDINGSDTGTRAFHGFPHDRMKNEIPPERDDYLTGEKYDPVAIYKGFNFPSAEDFGFADNSPVPPDHEKLKGRLVRFILPGNEAIILEPGRQYAFMILINEQGEDHGFTLANNYSGTYPDGHAIRRDGSGIFPPATANPLYDFTSPENREAYKSAHFPKKLQERLAIEPSTNGYPDVDTWRDLYFILQAY